MSPCAMDDGKSRIILYLVDGLGVCGLSVHRKCACVWRASNQMVCHLSLEAYHEDELGVEVKETQQAVSGVAEHTTF